MPEEKKSALVAGKIALVTGASRGLGRGIAHELGAQGATVVVSARTMKPEQSPFLGTSGRRVPGTLLETVELVRATGADVLALPADLRDERQVHDLISEVVERFGKIDILVNSATEQFSERYGKGEDDNLHTGLFWEVLPPSDWDTQMAVGLRSNYLTVYYSVPHMIRREGGLIVNLSSAGAELEYCNVAYRVVKAGTDRLTKALAHELRSYNTAVVSLWPRMTRTERWELISRGEHPGFESLKGTDLSKSHTPELSGRAIAYLAADHNIMERSGQILRVEEVARDYAFTDINGRVPY